MAKTHKYEEFSIEYGGRQYRGSYYIEKNVITVSSAWGGKSTQIGHSLPETLARIVFRELLDEAKARNDL